MKSLDEYIDPFLETYLNFIKIYLPQIDSVMISMVSISVILMILSIPFIFFGNIIINLFYLIFKIIVFIIIISVIGITIFILKN